MHFLRPAHPTSNLGENIVPYPLALSCFLLCVPRAQLYMFVYIASFFVLYCSCQEIRSEVGFKAIGEHDECERV